MPFVRIGQDFIVNSTTQNGQSFPSIMALADGRFVMTWSSGDPGDGSSTCIRARLYNVDGSAAGGDFIVNSTTQNDQSSPSITALADGRFVVAWDSGDPGDGSLACIRARVYNADGSAAAGDFIVNTTTTSFQQNPSITALADGRFVVTWASEDTGDGSRDCIRARIYNANGSAAGSDFIVNTTTTDDQVDPSITALADGRFVITWPSDDPGDSSEGCIRARVYNANGSAAGSDFVVNSTATGNQDNPSITALADGRFVVTWLSYDPGDGSGGCIRARLYNANGSAVGSDFIVNSTTENYQVSPSITALADGRFVAAWASEDPGDGSSLCVRARLYNADGSAAGGDFIVNSTATNGQYSPSITALADGRFVVTWDSDDPGDGSGYCIRAQIFDPTVFIGTAGEDSWKGGNLADHIYGGASADTLSGLGGDDLINGDAGNDSLDGGAGNDKLFGGDGNDTLTGGLGVDTLSGGTGNDQYIVDNAGDVVIEAAGQGTADRVYTSVNYVLGATAQIELFTTANAAGTAALNLTGNGFAQIMHGNAGANVLNGGGGADGMSGFGGNDQYVVDNAGDVVTEGAGQGTADRVYALVSYVLGAAAQVEVLTTTNAAGTGAINLVGNGFAQTILGNAGTNILNGGGGNDTMSGLGGNDVFVFNTALGATNVDTITDFANASGNNDAIFLENAIFTGLAAGALAAGAFASNTTGVATQADDRIIYETDTGKLFYDSNGSAAGGAIQFATLSANLAMTSADFFVI